MLDPISPILTRNEHLPLIVSEKSRRNNKGVNVNDGVLTDVGALSHAKSVRSKAVLGRMMFEVLCKDAPEVAQVIDDMLKLRDLKPIREVLLSSSKSELEVDLVRRLASFVEFNKPNSSKGWGRRTDQSQAAVDGLATSVCFDVPRMEAMLGSREAVAVALASIHATPNMITEEVLRRTAEWAEATRKYSRSESAKTWLM